MGDNESGKPESGELFGIPYNFEEPSIGRLLSSHWQPDEGMFVEQPTRRSRSKSSSTTTDLPGDGRPGRAADLAGTRSAGVDD
jgi:hypothetical protein